MELFAFAAAPTATGQGLPTNPFEQPSDYSLPATVTPTQVAFHNYIASNIPSFETAVPGGEGDSRANDTSYIHATTHTLGETALHDCDPPLCFPEYRRSTVAALDVDGNEVNISLFLRFVGNNWRLINEVYQIEGQHQKVIGDLAYYRRNLVRVQGLARFDRPIVAIEQSGIRHPVRNVEMSVVGLCVSADNTAEQPQLVSTDPVKGKPGPSDDKSEQPPEQLPFVFDNDPSPVAVTFGWLRLRFHNATQNNGRNTHQQFFKLRFSISAVLMDGTPIRLGEADSNRLIIRGRSPKNFQGHSGIPLRSDAKDKPRVRSSSGSKRNSAVIPKAGLVKTGSGPSTTTILAMTDSTVGVVVKPGTPATTEFSSPPAEQADSFTLMSDPFDLVGKGPDLGQSSSMQAEWDRLTRSIQGGAGGLPGTHYTFLADHSVVGLDPNAHMGSTIGHGPVYGPDLMMPFVDPSQQSQLSMDSIFTSAGSTIPSQPAPVSQSQTRLQVPGSRASPGDLPGVSKRRASSSSSSSSFSSLSSSFAKLPLGAPESDCFDWSTPSGPIHYFSSSILPTSSEIGTEAGTDVGTEFGTDPASEIGTDMGTEFSYEHLIADESMAGVPPVFSNDFMAQHINMDVDMYSHLYGSSVHGQGYPTTTGPDVSSMPLTNPALTMDDYLPHFHLGMGENAVEDIYELPLH